MIKFSNGSWLPNVFFTVIAHKNEHKEVSNKTDYLAEKKSLVKTT